MSKLRNVTRIPHGCITTSTTTLPPGPQYANTTMINHNNITKDIFTISTTIVGLQYSNVWNRIPLHSWFIVNDFTETIQVPSTVWLNFLHQIQNPKERFHRHQPHGSFVILTLRNPYFQLTAAGKGHGDGGSRICREDEVEANVCLLARRSFWKKS